MFILFIIFFLPDRPTHLRESEGDGKRNILLGWSKGHVNFASHNCLFTSFVLQGKGKNGEKQRQSASDASRIDPSYLSARVQFSRLYPHRGAWSQAKRHPATVSPPIDGFHAISGDTNNNGEMNKCWWTNKAS